MIIYYTSLVNHFVYEPEALAHSFFSRFEDSDQIKTLKKCPAFADYFHNTYVIKNFVNYNLNWRGGTNVSSDYFNQEFCQKMVILRDPNSGFFSFLHPWLMFLSDTPVEMTLLPPFLHSVDIHQKASMIPAVYNVGKHFRPVECSFIFNEPNSTINFKIGEPQYYVSFKTEEKITFKKFYYSDKIKDLQYSMINLRDGVQVKPLSFWYDVFGRNYRKTVMKLIKENLLD